MVPDPAGPTERRLMDALFAPEGRSDPVRAARGVGVDGCRHEFVTAALHEQRLRATPIPPSPDLMFQVASRFLSRIDGSRHRATRGAFTGLFSPRRVERYRDGIAATANRLLDTFPAAGPIDLVSAFARPLPFSVIARVLGVPDHEHAWLAERMEIYGRAVAGQRDRANVEAGNIATAQMLDLFEGLLRDRRARPTEDVLSLLAANTEHESRDDVLANCVFFILAGHATTTTLLTAGVHLLSTRPDQLAHVRARRTSWPLVVDELLRYVSPTTLTGVTATDDIEVAGCPVPAGAGRAIVYAAANRDPAVFKAPDVFDTTRDPNPHLAFSAGVHYCLGAPLARLHGEVALALLFDRLRGLRALEDPVWIGSVPIRQVARLQVTWDAPTAG